MELFSPGHLIPLLIIVAVLFFGWKQMPDMARSLGRSLRVFKTEIKGLSEDDKQREDAKVEQAAIEAPKAEFVKTDAAARGAVQQEVVTQQVVREQVVKQPVAHTQQAPNRPRPAPSPNARPAAPSNSEAPSTGAQ